MTTPYRPDQLMAILRDDLAAYVAGGRGTVSVARDPWAVLELLAEAPAGWRLILHYAGYAPLGDEDQEPLVTHKIEVIVSANLGLGAKLGEALFERAAGGSRASLLELISGVIDRVLSLEFPDEITGRVMRDRGLEPVVAPDGVPCAAYKLTVELDAAMPPVTYRTAPVP